ncbi:oxygen-independent coproporphyrinogen III oxidase [bacterium]|nr:oxygen-independent coproporphyrinogen III oxidase [bacterium]
MYQFTEEIISKYSVIGPRYTSYPTAPIWHEIDRKTQNNWLESNAGSERAISLYIHIPFCRERCLYCGCNVVVTRQQKASSEYVPYLLREIESIAKVRQRNRVIKQIHFGGGTPNFLLNSEIEQIMNHIKDRFELNTDTEIGIEIDPCSTHPQLLDFLSGIGFNRLSLGVQDINETVQRAVNRIQSKETTYEHLVAARQAGFKGINFDLIYGLPFQTLQSFRETVDEVIRMRPDRLAVYNFGYLPDRMIHQRKIKPETLPNPATKLEILLDTINRFSEAGYNYIGMDHFSLPDDELSVAQKNRTLYRNFMGYTPKSGMDLYGIGMTAISEFDRYFIQNEKKLKGYKDAVDSESLSGSRGLKLSDDDQRRKWTIMKLICHFYLDFDEFQKTFEQRFTDYFADEFSNLKELEEDGLIEIHSDSIVVKNIGQILVRNICMIFDAYLMKQDTPPVKYSKTI